MYPITLPWVDDWEWIENLYLKEISLSEWLTQKTNIHFILIPKLIFFGIFYFFNSNYYLISIISISIIFISCFFVLFHEKKLSNVQKIIIILLITSPKIFPNISQFCNLAWFTSFLLILSFNYFIFYKSNFLFIVNLLILFIAPFNFGLSIVIPIYSLAFIYFYNLSLYKKFFYFVFSLISLSLFITNSFTSTNETNLFISILSLLDPKSFIIFFGSLANLYVPWSESFVFIAFFIGILQIFFIFLILYNNCKYNNPKTIIITFIQNNYLIIAGVIFAFLLSITRIDFQSVVASRYVIGSILFQIGFFIFIFNNINLSNIQFNILKYLIIFYYFASFFVPYQGIHWHIDRYIKSTEVIECFEYNDTNNCIKNAYNVVFYGGDWYHYESFEKVINIMIKNNTSIFNKF